MLITRLPSPLPPAAQGVLSAALAGFVDLATLLSLGGIFASSMTANLTVVAQGVGTAYLTAAIAAAAIACFFAGAMFAAMTEDRFAGHGRSMTWAWVSGLLALCALATSPGSLSLLPIAATMGAVHYRHTASHGPLALAPWLVALGAGAAARAGGRSSGLDREAVRRQAIIWAGFLAGGLQGVGLYLRFGLHALLAPAVLCLVAALLCWPRSVSFANASESDGVRPDG